jgi:hypothetical protein
VSEGRVLDALDSTVVRVVTADGLAGFATASSVELGVSQCFHSDISKASAVSPDGRGFASEADS